MIFTQSSLTEQLNLSALIEDTIDVMQYLTVMVQYDRIRGLLYTWKPKIDTNSAWTFELKLWTNVEARTNDSYFGRLNAEGGRFEFDPTMPPAAVPRWNIGDFKSKWINLKLQTSAVVFGRRPLTCHYPAGVVSKNCISRRTKQIVIHLNYIQSSGRFLFLSS